METLLLISVNVIVLLIGLGTLIYFLIPKQKEQKMVKDKLEENFLVDDQYSHEQTTIVDVQFNGYNGIFTYATMQQDVRKGQHVLVLTQDGIRCAKVLTDPREITLNQLSFPPFLLQSIICVADEADLEYYN
ncbi:MAG: hypothetical protein K2G70_07445 [Turicibacter sp.]|nr:hypothetical protein [Turicibacter sp.]